jgi:hypothetical protein
MIKALNIRKEYKIDKPVEEIFSRLNAIISDPFNNSRYTLFGNFISVDPPEFLLMAKWWSIGRPLLAEAASTRLLARVIKDGENSKVIVTSKTNPAFVIAFAVTVVILLIKLLTINRELNSKQWLPYVLIATLLIIVDRFIKKMALAGFERDIDFKAA